MWLEDFLTNREMRTVIRDRIFNWCPVVSGVSQGSVLALILIVVYINDKVDGVFSYVFADDVKLPRRVGNVRDCGALQRDQDRTW